MSTLRRVLITRPLEHTERMAAVLRALGIEPVIVPSVSIESLGTYALLDDAVRSLDRYQWVLFTSRTGVRIFFERVVAAGRPVPGHLRWAAVGPGTGIALHTHDIADVWIPTRYLSESLGDELPAQRGDRVLRIRGQTASPFPASRLRSRGIDVVEVVAYRTVEAPPESVPLLREAFAGGIDAAVFTSASTVRGFAHLVRQADLEALVGPMTLIAIGPVTAHAIRELGWPVHLVADEYSLDGIAAVLARRQANASGIDRN